LKSENLAAIFSVIYPKIPKTYLGMLKKFKLTLKRFLLMGSFYTLDEYFDWSSRSDLDTFM